MLHEDDADEAEEAADDVEEDHDLDDAEPAAELDDDLDLDSIISGADRASTTGQGELLCTSAVERVMVAAEQSYAANVRHPSHALSSYISAAELSPACQECSLHVTGTRKTARSFGISSNCSVYASKVCHMALRCACQARSVEVGLQPWSVR